MTGRRREAPVLDVSRRAAWLAGHPGGTAERQPDTLVYRAKIDGAVTATAYGSLDALMDAVDEAESSGGCPLHPLAVIR